MWCTAHNDPLRYRQLQKRGSNRYGRVEVPFYWMAMRPPFDELAVRREFLDRLNTVPGIALPVAKVGLRPSFSVEVLGDEGATSRLRGALEWFVITCRAAAETALRATD